MLLPHSRAIVWNPQQTPQATTRHRAALGLGVLDPSAKPTVSELVPLFNNPTLCKEPAYVLASMGGQGLPPLRSAVKTALKKAAPPAWQGLCAIWALAQFPTNGQAIVPEVLAGLTNKNPAFRQTCAWALARIQTDPEVAVPALTNCVNVQGMRYFCLKALENYGPRAKSAVPFLVEMSRAEKRRSRDVAEALMAIDPGEAEKAGL
jgi:hypothetical protein